MNARRKRRPSLNSPSSSNGRDATGRRGRSAAASLGATGAFLVATGVGCGTSSPQASADPDPEEPSIEVTGNDPAMTDDAERPTMGADDGADDGVDEAGPSGDDLGLEMPTEEEPDPPALDADEVVTDVDVQVHPQVNTLLVVTWNQTESTDEAWLEFSFEEGNLLTSRAKPGVAGENRDVVIGVPGDAEVTVRVVLRRDDEEFRSADYLGRTQPVPAGMPRPEVLSFDPDLASSDRYMFGAVEDSAGGCNNQTCFYHTTFWLYVIDRQGRILWYYADPSSNATSSFQRVARDGEYIWIEKRPFGSGGQRGVLKMTLDWSYAEEIAVPRLADCIDVTDDGSLLYNVDGQDSELREMTAEGDVRSIWSCAAAFGPGVQCYSNTVNWNPLGDTVLMSFPYQNTVVEIDRQSGQLVGQYGDAPGSWAFSPPSWEFEFQHFANITPEGTLLVSSHMPGFASTEQPVAGEHAFMEFELDRENQTLVEKWVYNEGPEWAMYKGMAIRLPNGNTLANYGTGGVIREITPDKQTAFYVKFDSERGNDFFNKMVGHNVLVDDLYALSGGGPSR